MLVSPGGPRINAAMLVDHPVSRRAGVTKGLLQRKDPFKAVGIHIIKVCRRQSNSFSSDPDIEKPQGHNTVGQVSLRD